MEAPEACSFLLSQLQHSTDIGPCSVTIATYCNKDLRTAKKLKRASRQVWSCAVASSRMKNASKSVSRRTPSKDGASSGLGFRV